ncbi:hypothetical protein V6M85_03255 [Sulfolobus tengchongensis]|uniref:CRISPR-associated protein Cas4 n=1 Tax=Sulfolobus tengchongensis TaxID=207809 RepID=A0AAX4L2I7_9CREN
MPARIFDDLLICKQRAYFTLTRAKAIEDQRLLYEKKNDIGCGETEPKYLFLNVGLSWYKVVGIPDCIRDNLVIEFTITRGMIKHLIGRAVIYSYMAMRDGNPYSTLIIPTTIGEDTGYLVIPNSRVIDYLSESLKEVIEEKFKASKNKFCNACLYKRQCAYYYM